MLCALGVPIGISSCASSPAPANPPEVDRCTFDAKVYPVLARDCGFPACHGDPGRFFRIWSPGRFRLSEDTELLAPATEEELAASFERARSMLAGPADPEDSLLLRKPLAAESGGSAHFGSDNLGRNVYADQRAAGWVAISEWAKGETCP